MLEDKVFIIKLAAVDGLAAGAVVVGEVPSLAHKLWDDAMKAASLKAKALLMRAQAAEVLYMKKRCHTLSDFFVFQRGMIRIITHSVHTCRHGNDVSPKEEAKSPCWFVSNLDVHVDLRINSALFSRGLSLQEQIILVSLS